MPQACYKCYRCGKDLEPGYTGYCGMRCYKKGPVFMAPWNAAVIGKVMDDERRAANPFWDQHGPVSTQDMTK
jgi:hypothetical protein